MHVITVALLRNNERVLPLVEASVTQPSIPVRIFGIALRCRCDDSLGFGNFEAISSFLDPGIELPAAEFVFHRHFVWHTQHAIKHGIAHIILFLPVKNQHQYRYPLLAYLPPSTRAIHPTA